ncbi:hypothetical protein C8Q76DRAFT_794647 [Earliella scabrosa]|nr:hypothetical protein C8Q76DRAFT_794647 [Earliella scabrosa]
MSRRSPAPQSDYDVDFPPLGTTTPSAQNDLMSDVPVASFSSQAPRDESPAGVALTPQAQNLDDEAQALSEVAILRQWEEAGLPIRATTSTLEGATLPSTGFFPQLGPLDGDGVCQIPEPQLAALAEPPASAPARDGNAAGSEAAGLREERLTQPAPQTPQNTSNPFPALEATWGTNMGWPAGEGERQHASRKRPRVGSPTQDVPDGTVSTLNRQQAMRVPRRGLGLRTVRGRTGQLALRANEPVTPTRTGRSRPLVSTPYPHPLVFPAHPPALHPTALLPPPPQPTPPQPPAPTPQISESNPRPPSPHLRDEDYGEEVTPVAPTPRATGGSTQQRNATLDLPLRPADAEGALAQQFRNPTPIPAPNPLLNRPATRPAATQEDAAREQADLATAIQRWREANPFCLAPPAGHPVPRLRPRTTTGPPAQLPPYGVATWYEYQMIDMGLADPTEDLARAARNHAAEFQRFRRQRQGGAGQGDAHNRARQDQPHQSTSADRGPPAAPAHDASPRHEGMLVDVDFQGRHTGTTDREQDLILQLEHERERLRRLELEVQRITRGRQPERGEGSVAARAAERAQRHEEGRPAMAAAAPGVRALGGPGRALPRIALSHPEQLFRDLDPAYVTDLFRDPRGTSVLLQIAGQRGPLPVGQTRDVLARVAQAVTEITNETDFHITSPRPDPANPDATPVTWAVRNLTPTATRQLLEAQVLSNAGVTFFVHERAVGNATLALTLHEFTSNFGNQIETMVRTTLESARVRDLIAAQIRENPAFDELPTNYGVDYTLETVEIVVDTLANGAIVANIYMESPAHTTHGWETFTAELRRVPFVDGYNSPAVPRTFRCSICHASDHPTHACRYPRIPGWRGPVPTAEQRPDAPPPGAILALNNLDGRRAPAGRGGREQNPRDDRRGRGRGGRGGGGYGRGRGF